MKDNYDNTMADKDPQYAKLDEFCEQLRALKNKDRIQLVNPGRLEQFYISCAAIISAVKADNEDAEVTYGVHELGDGSAFIRIEAEEVVIRNINNFIRGIKFANNFEIYPLTNGKIRIGIMFNKLMHDIVNKQDNQDK